MTCIFIGFARLPVGDAATIIFCSPIFVMIFSHVVLREHCGLYRVFVILLLIIGVILIAKPPFLVKLLFPNDNTQVRRLTEIDRVLYFCFLKEKTRFSIILQIWLLLTFLDTLSPFWSHIKLIPTILTNDLPILKSLTIHLF